MPYGHIKQYRELIAEAQKKRIQITKKQQQQIAKLYRDIAKDLGKEIARKSEKTLTYRWLKDYAKSLKGQSKQIYADLQGIVGAGIFDTAVAVSRAEEQFWGGIMPGVSERFRDAFSSIPQTCVDELMNGGIYKDFTGLSERLWNYKGKFDRDIGYIINRGIIEQKSAYDLAKDLEMYVDPQAKKPWEWRKVYPNCNRVVDYNAQRLARTSVTHAYQLSFQRSTRNNPFIEKYQWHSSNAGKTCELCRERDGKMFPKNRVPLDHPNGMCIITAVIPKSMDEIGEELSDWAAGKRNPELDRWLGRHTRPIKNKKLVEKHTDSVIIKEKGNILKMDLQFFAEKDIKNQESVSLKRAIRKYQFRIGEHEAKISNPSEFYPEWDSYDIRYQEGLKRHWNKEIRNFKQSIQERIDELKSRGDYDE
ncbi:hypothetical protein H8S37_12660 [Mediterraneibacter sp. NSJ-55]|uniref:Minor capsid protein n=1 Tax=Mediterraneibacter hominis TaxID=2763054 RepID=A0A923LKU2_9FIRM|nr:hypothetical protein [Mediterraneibacter hominis]MBC5689769.1 hypothetical protein [Mediterraneibacter hominis]